jgi:hypothetical protein
MKQINIKNKRHKNIKMEGEWETKNLDMMILHPPLD